MPNQPRTPARTIRINDDLWTGLKVAAAEEGRTPSDIVRDLIEDYLRRRRGKR